jgi:hypothetical protein
MTSRNRSVDTANTISESDLERDLELENILGNLMIAQYQVDKLRSRLSERIGGYGSAGNLKGSTFVFQHNDKKYVIKLDAKEMAGKVDDCGLHEELKRTKEVFASLQKDHRNECRRADALFDKLNIAKDRVMTLQQICRSQGIELAPFDIKLITA